MRLEPPSGFGELFRDDSKADANLVSEALPECLVGTVDELPRCLMAQKLLTRF